MQKNIKVIDEPWIQWIAVNLNRGCNPFEMVHQMEKNGFHPEYSRAYLEMVSKKISNKEINITGNHPSEFTWTPPNQKGNGLVASHGAVNIVAQFNNPQVLVLENVLSPQMCDMIIECARSKLKPSKVVGVNTGDDTHDDGRKSFGTDFKNEEFEWVRAANERFSSILNIPEENGEGLQILRYLPGGEYRPHFDFFPPSDKGSQKHLVHGGQRIATLVVYLNDVEEGGSTSFPDVGLKVYPKKGNAVYFKYENEDGSMNPLSLHAGDPVIQGEKWILTKWMRKGQFK